MKWAAVSLVALSVLCAPAALRAEDFTAASVATALNGFGNDFRRSNCFLGWKELRPLQIAVAQMDPNTSKFRDYEQETISEWVEEALTNDPMLVVASQRRHWEMAEIRQALGQSKALAKDPLDGIIIIREVGGRINVIAHANDTLSVCHLRTITAGRIVEVPDVPEKFFERAAKRLPANGVEQLVVMPPEVTGVTGNPGRVLGQQLQEQLADGIKQVFQRRVRENPGNAVLPLVLTYSAGLDLSRAWQAQLRARRMPQGGIEVRVDFRGPPDSQSGSLADRGYLAPDIVPTDTDPVVREFAEKVCRDVQQAIDTQTDPAALQAIARDGLCPRLNPAVAAKEKLQQDLICSEDQTRWNEAARRPLEAMETVAGTLRCKQVADDAQKELRHIADMKSNAVDLGTLTDGVTVQRKIGIGGAAVGAADGTWKFQMTEVDILAVQFADPTTDDLGLVFELFDSSWNPIGTKTDQSTRKLKEYSTLGKLNPGAYYIRISTRDSRKGSFTLRVAKGWIDTIGDTIETARDLGSLGPPGTQTVRKRIGGFDQGDVYKFTVPERLRLQLAAAEMTSDVQLDLLDQTGQVIQSRRGRDRQNVEEILQPRLTYYVAVKPAGEITPYSLDIALSRPHTENAPVVPAPSTVNAPVVPAPSTVKHTLTANDTEYFRWFQLVGPASVSVDLTWEDKKTELDLYLHKEEPGGKFLLQRRSDLPNTVSQKISDLPLDPGTYRIRVKRNAGSSPETPFTLNMHGATLNPAGPESNPSSPASNPGNPNAGNPAPNPGNPNAGNPASKPGGPTSNPSNPASKPSGPASNPGNPVSKPGGPTPRPGAMLNPTTPASNSTNPTSKPGKEAATTVVIATSPFTYTLPANENDFSGSISVTDRSRVTAVLNWADRAIDLDMDLKDENGKEIAASHGTIPREDFERVLEPGTYTLHVYRSRPTSAAAVQLRLTVNKAALPTRSTSSQPR